MNGERAARYELTGLQRTHLEWVRERMTAEDRPDPHDFRGEVDAEGMIHFRPATLSDHLEWAVARWVWHEQLESRGDVG